MCFKKGRDCVRKPLRMKTLKKEKDLNTNLYKCVVVNIFLVFSSFKNYNLTLRLQRVASI